MVYTFFKKSEKPVAAKAPVVEEQPVKEAEPAAAKPAETKAVEKAEEAVVVEIKKKKVDFIFIFAVLLVVILATLLIIVSVTNSPPVANPEKVITQEDTPIQINLTGSDKDDKDQLTYNVVTYPSHGNLTGMVLGYQGVDRGGFLQCKPASQLQLLLEEQGFQWV